MSNLSHLVARALCKGKLRNLPETSGDAAVHDTRGLMIEREAVEESFRDVATVFTDGLLNFIAIELCVEFV